MPLPYAMWVKADPPTRECPACKKWIAEKTPNSTEEYTRHYMTQHVSLGKKEEEKDG